MYLSTAREKYGRHSHLSFQYKIQNVPESAAHILPPSVLRIGLCLQDAIRTLHYIDTEGVPSLQFHQLGIEFLGETHAYADVEAIAMAWELLGMLSVRPHVKACIYMIYMFMYMRVGLPGRVVCRRDSASAECIERRIDALPPFPRDTVAPAHHGRRRDQGAVSPRAGCVPGAAQG
jgi:hypothetical protein